MALTANARQAGGIGGIHPWRVTKPLAGPVRIAEASGLRQQGPGDSRIPPPTGEGLAMADKARVPGPASQPSEHREQPQAALTAAAAGLRRPVCRTRGPRSPAGCCASSTSSTPAMSNGSPCRWCWPGRGSPAAINLSGSRTWLGPGHHHHHQVRRAGVHGHRGLVLHQQRELQAVERQQGVRDRRDRRRDGYRPVELPGRGSARKGKNR